MSAGGKREGAGRKKGYAAIQAEKSREIIVKQLETEWAPIVEKAIEQAKNGDAVARNWVSERGYGRVPQAIMTEDEEGNIVPLQTINVVPIDGQNS